MRIRNCCYNFKYKPRAKKDVQNRRQYKIRYNQVQADCADDDCNDNYYYHYHTCINDFQCYCDSVAVSNSKT